MLCSLARKCFVRMILAACRASASQADAAAPNLQGYNDLEHYETPYVVKMHRFTPLSPPQPVFSFHHPTAKTPTQTTPAASASHSSGTACLRPCAMA